MTDQEYQAAMWAANDWRYLMTVISTRLIGRQAKLLHHKSTTKGDLDTWLMARYGISRIDARSISNYSGEVIEHRVGDGRVVWVGKRPAPTFEDYPELAVLLPVEEVQ